MVDGKEFRTTARSENYTHEDIKRTLNSGNVSCHSLQSLLPSRLLCKSSEISIYDVSYGYDTWYITVREDTD
jgi:hypothetical protein